VKHFLTGLHVPWAVLLAVGVVISLRRWPLSYGAFAAAMLRIAGVEGPRLQRAEVARLIVWLASRDSEPLSGANLRLDPH